MTVKELKQLLQFDAIYYGGGGFNKVCWDEKPTPKEPKKRNKWPFILFFLFLVGILVFYYFVAPSLIAKYEEIKPTDSLQENAGNIQKSINELK